ncbi:MAG: FG-GAP-like repeat-containing protein [bacterium]
MKICLAFSLCMLVPLIHVHPSFAQEWVWQRDDLVLNPSGLDLTDVTSWAWGDLDRDGHVDVILRKKGSTVDSRLVAYRGRNSSAPPYWEEAPELLASLDESRGSKGVVLVDLNGDHWLDLVTEFEADRFTSTWNLLFWKKDSENRWQADSTVFRGIELAYPYRSNEPHFADADNDGDLDMVLGSYPWGANEKFRFYINAGDASHPIWEEDSTRIELVNQAPAGYESWSPILAHVDDDQLLDLVVAYVIEGFYGLAVYPGVTDGLDFHWAGRPQYFQQEFFGGIRKLVPIDMNSDRMQELVILEEVATGRVYHDRSFASSSYFRLGPINFNYYASATPFDYNHDQTMELLAGGFWGGFYSQIDFDSYEKAEWVGWQLWKQTGWFDAPFRIYDLALVKIGLTDIDRNGLSDLIISSVKSYSERTDFMAYENADPNLRENWNERNDLIAPFYNQGRAPDTSYFEASFADLDGDGDPDILVQQKLYVGPDSGKCAYRFFENELGAGTIHWKARSDWLNGLEPSLEEAFYGNFGDLDLDGDHDLVFGTESGTLMLYENVGNQTSPRWRLNRDAFSGIDLGGYATPSFGDSDRDGKLDMFVGTRSGNLVFYRNETIVKVEEDNSDLRPGAFSLAQNFPNPFNPATTIEYELAKPGRVQLAIYNLLGQRVRILVDARQPAGSYRVHWDGRVEGGAKRVASGVYVYELQVGKFTARKKLLLIR